MNSAETLYKQNKKKASVLAKLAPITFWGCLAFSLICLAFALKHSLGNVLEIMDLLDKSKFSGEVIAEHYNMLIERYGEWVIGTGDKGFVLTFINIKNAIFGWFGIANAIMAVVFFLSAYILGKWLFPYLAKSISQNNQDMVNLTILKNQK